MRLGHAIPFLGATTLALVACAEEPTTGAAETPRVSAGDADVLAEAMVEEPPIRLSGPPLVYPASRQDAGFEGHVIFEVVMGIDGRPKPESFRVVESSHRAFEPSARETVLGSSYRPGRMHGEAVRVLLRQPIKYAIRR